jgi:hypothetical protein
MKAPFLIAFCALLCAPAFAAVADSAANGFTVKIAVTIQASPADVYSKLVRGVGDWWDSEHTFSGSAHNLSIDDKPLGCWCEKVGSGAVRHMQVITAIPGKALIFSGGLGPLQSMAVSGTLSFTFAEDKGATKLQVTYAAGGYLPAGLNTLAEPVDTVLTQQINRFKNFVEIGSPEPAR